MSEYSLPIALIALIASVASLILNQHFNRLKIKPLPELVPYDFENSISLAIENKGTGPLINGKIKAICNGDSKSSIIDFMPDLPMNYYWDEYSRSKKISLLPGERKVLIKLSGDLNDEIFMEFKSEVRKKLGSIRILFTYSNIYGDKPHPLKSDLSFFHEESPKMLQK